MTAAAAAAALALDTRVNVWCVPLQRRFAHEDAGAIMAGSALGGGASGGGVARGLGGGSPSDSRHVALPLARPGESPEQTVQRLASMLSAEERAVAEGFDSAERRRTYVVAHALLRVILSRMAGVAPNEIIFRYGRRGKPELASPSEDLQFNMSHSRDMMLIAVARGRRVGVDIEHIDEPGDVRRITARFLSPRDRDAIEQLPADRQRDAFLRCWTRKEAYMKARGDGISRPLDDFDVTTITSSSRARLRSSGGPNDTDAWELADVVAPRGFMAALAVEGHDFEVVQHNDWPHVN